MLDAARALLIQNGTRAATITAIAEASGVPIGSIYHRFGSLETLIARLWMRAVYRSQASFVTAVENADAVEAAVAGAVSIVDFARQHPHDARLLASFGREELIGATPTGPLAEELAEVNRPVQRVVGALSERLYGKRTRRAIDRTMLAVFDLPYGATKRYLVAGQKLPARLRSDVEIAVRSVLEAPL